MATEAQRKTKEGDKVFTPPSVFDGQDVRRSGVPNDAAYAGLKPRRRLRRRGWRGDGHEVLMPSAERRSEKRSAEGRGPRPPPFVNR